jgi:hypothetical protein
MSGLDKVVLELIEDKLETVLAPYAEILRIANRPKKDKYGYSNKEAMLYMEIGKLKSRSCATQVIFRFSIHRGNTAIRKRTWTAT